MIVSQLMAALSQMDPDLPVYVGGTAIGGPPESLEHPVIGLASVGFDAFDGVAHFMPRSGQTHRAVTLLEP